MRYITIAIILLLSTLALAQSPSSFYTDRALGVNPFAPNAGATPSPVFISYGWVRVCNLPITTFSPSPCLPLATITDINTGANLSVIGGNFGQLQTDVVGRFNFGCTGQNFLIQVAATSSNTPQLQYKATCPVGGNFTGTTLNLPSQTFVTLNGQAACSLAFTGTVASISDSTTQTQGAIVTGGGTFNVLAYCNGTNYVVVSGNVGTTTVTTYIPADECTNDQTLNPGNSFWSVVHLTNWDFGHWEYVAGAPGHIYCIYRVPHAVAGTPNASWVIDPSSADNTAGHTTQMRTCDTITSALNPQVGALVCAGYQNYTTTSTAYSSTELLFTVQATVVADQILVVDFQQNTGGANTSNIVMPPPKLKIDQIL